MPINNIEGLLDRMNTDNIFEEVEHFVSVGIVRKISERGTATAFDGHVKFPFSTGILYLRPGYD